MPSILRSSPALFAKGQGSIAPLACTNLPTILQWSDRWCSPACRSQSSRASSTAPVKSEQQKQPMICLERSVGARQGIDAHLWSQGSFSAEVYPDLPIATSWGELFGMLPSSKGEASPDINAAAKHGNQRLIRTVGCQVRSRANVKQRLQQAAQCRVDGALILSGSHPAHSIAASLGYTPNSTEMLKKAAGMKKEGTLPSNFELWAVENPLRNPVSRLEAKIEAGAQVILTQPPLIWHIFSDWWSEIHRSGLSSQAAIVVGVPMLTSVGNLRFWLHLCQCSALPGAAELVQRFKDESGDREQFAHFARAYNQDLVQKVLQLPGVGGIHIMPLTKAGREQVLEFQQDGIIPRAATHCHPR